jgi:hypothetical protein
MQNNYSCEISAPKSARIDLQPEEILDIENENTDSASAVIKTKLRNVITEGEIEVLTSWFPKAAQTLARVLRERPN